MKMVLGMEYLEHLDNCRLIASRIVADVKLYPNSKVRDIVNAYWEQLPRLKANQTTYVLELFKKSDMDSLATFYAEVAIRDCIVNANERNYFNPSEEVAFQRKHEIKQFALMLKDSADFYKQMEELE